MSEDKLPWTLKAGWATGAFGVAVLMNGISALILFYMTLVLKFDPVKTRHVRVVGTKLRQNPQDNLFSMQFVELEVYGAQ